MKKRIITPLAFWLIILLIPNNLLGENLYAHNGGAWNDVNTWGGTRIPNENDTVYITSSLLIPFDYNATVYKLHISNNSLIPTDYILLTIEHSALLDVKENIIIQEESNNSKSAGIAVFGNLKVGNNLSINRNSLYNGQNGFFIIGHDNASIKVNKNIVSNYLNGADTATAEIDLLGHSSLEVLGNLVLNMNNSLTDTIYNSFILSNNSSAIIRGNLILNRQGTGKGHISVSVRDQSSLDVSNKIILNNIEDGNDVYLNVSNNATLKTSYLDINHDGGDDIQIRLDDSAIANMDTIDIYKTAGDDTRIYLNDKNGNQASLHANYFNALINDEGCCTPSNRHSVEIRIYENALFKIAGNMNYEISSLSHNSGFSTTIGEEGSSSSSTLEIGGSLSLNNMATVAANSKTTILFKNHNESKVKCNGNMMFKANSSLDIKFENYDESHLFIGGEFLRPTSFGQLKFYENSTLVYNGSNTQKIAGDNLSGSKGDNFLFQNIIINNNSNMKLPLEGLVTVNGTLSLNRGILKSTIGKELVFTENALVEDASTLSFVDGPVIKYGNADFIFPVGKGTSWMPIKLHDLIGTSSSTGIKVEYFNIAPENSSDLSINVSEISDKEFWNLELISGNLSSFGLELLWADATESFREGWNNHIIVNLNDTRTSGDFLWENIGNGVTTGSSFSSGGKGSLFTSNLNYLGNVTFGNNESNPLPIRYMQINGRALEKSIEINWELEYTNSLERIIIEKYTNNAWITLIETPPSSPSNLGLSHYRFIDDTPIIGTNYYRIKVIDQYSQATYSNILGVEYIEAQLWVYPTLITPTSNSISIQNLNKIIELSIVDLQGKTLFNTNEFEINRSKYTFYIPHQLLSSSKIYILRLQEDNGEIHNVKLFYK